MFAAIYEFVVIDGREESFLQAWEELTRLIYMHEGSMGSRMHKSSEGKYIAYAQWPERSTWENAGDKLPEKAKEWRIQLRDSCEEINTLYELESINDLLKVKPFNT